MKTASRSSTGTRDSRLQRAFPAIFGAFLGLTLLKFGNPPIMEKWITPPTNIWQFLLWTPWPINWAYGLLALVTLLRLPVFRLNLPPIRWRFGLLLLWLAWQCLAALGTIDPQLSGPTLAHFVACALCFVIGYACLPAVGGITSVLLGLLVGYLLVLAIGFQQHFGGLEETRRFFYSEMYSQLGQVSPDYIKKISSPRIFSTLFYPNALAGVLLLLLPAMLVLLWQARAYFTRGARMFLVAGVCATSLACLVWSGSKGGWLLMLFAGLIALLRLPFARRLKMVLIVGVLLAGIAGFTWKYHAFFQKGATSVVARFDYWSAAIQTGASHPWLGTGPGTFAKPYQAIKRPEAEMARLVHNDYLEQASDSGWLGFLSYVGFIGASLVLTYPRRGTSAGPQAAPEFSSAGIRFALWLGLLTWAIQGLFEFGLYIPALAWPAFCFLGLLSQDLSVVPKIVRQTKPGSVVSARG